MKNKCLYEKLNDQKGAAAIITLSVILVLTVLGTIALVVSTMSVTMSGKTVKWSDEYYTMDSMAEDYIHQIDSVIADAEKDARLYVQNRLDRIKPTTPDALKTYMNSKSLSFTGNYDYDMNISTTNLFNEDVQEFFYEYYKYDWIEGIDELTLNDYHAHKLTGDLDTISQSYAAAFAADGTILSAETAFERDINNYVAQLFDRVYYHMLSIRLLEYTEGYDTITGGTATFPTTQNVVLKGGSAAYGHREPDSDYRCTNKYINISYTNVSTMLTNWNTNLNPSISGNNIGLYIRIQGGTVQDPKQVRVDVDVTLPDYHTVTKYVYTPIYGNPILTNALSAQGTVTFDDGAKAEIVGDVYSSSIGGISIKEDADVKMRGNVYTPGDLQVVGNNGKLTVDTVFTNPTPAISYDFKQKTYSNDYLYDNTVNGSVDINLYAPGGMLDQMPFVFFDKNDQGNVYCDSVFISSEDAVINIKGNLWTKDDIQLDANRSTIRIGQAVTDPVTGKIKPKYNYIGLSPESAVTGVGVIDHRASSSVINNYPYTPANMPSSEIVMNSNMLVPGVAFYEFQGGVVYMSVESVTSRTSNPISVLNAYLHDPAKTASEEPYDYYTNSDGVQIELIDANLLEKRQRLIDFIKNTKPEYGSVKMNINSDLNPDEIDGYIAGVALVNTNDPDDDPSDPSDDVEMFTHAPYVQADVSKLINSENNYIAFSDLNTTNTLKKIFYSKTRKLGTVGSGVDSTDAVPFSDFVDSTVDLTHCSTYEIKVVTDGKLNVNAVNEGIVYCDGDLTISSEATGIDPDPTDAEFRGTIICTGNVIIKDNVKLVYDEYVILEKLKNYYYVRKFFENIPAASYFTMNKIAEVDMATSSGERNVVKRLRIKSWRELPVSP